MIIWFWPSELTGVISMALRLEGLETPVLVERADHRQYYTTMEGSGKILENSSSTRFPSTMIHENTGESQFMKICFKI
ncbi:hypothetical protein TNCT_664011 [Trichonephila clavata]|uniref:Uncharacterized protein n=1 Tax=Trichonephila clavata TaxID=2740835 RepID=A0A8X6L540_TRICU|nr:hypothetical protein TNCT_664011 [Trichonephila clavata]